MAKDLWFISDTHFFHENIIQYCGRPFKDAQFMNEYMIQMWNETVKPQDKVYHLGDVGLGFGGDDEKLMNLLSRLNGHKRLIVGNHDNLKSEALKNNFEKIELWYGRKEWDFTCSHIPLNQRHLRDGWINVHGHLHNNISPEFYHINICVEHIDYKPIHIDEIKKKIKEIAKEHPSINS